MPVAVVAIGGNALSRVEESGTIEQQFANTRLICSKLESFVEEGWDLVLTHGNGPQVGSMLWRVELAAQQVHPVDLGICDANSQGQIGYMLQQVLGNALRSRGIDRAPITLVTQVEVDPQDPAFADPRKPIGRYFDAAEARVREREYGWRMHESKRGWRRVVPSPKPLRVLEVEAIRQCLRAGLLPIAAGGGGIPVVRRAHGGYDGVEAVIDKDLTAGLLARRLAADVLIICTAVPAVLLDHGTARERPLSRATASAMTRHLEEGQFPAGSMGPKVQGCIDFIAGGGIGTSRRALITDIDSLQDAVHGRAGTVILPDR
jgi:carbamate kinase